MSNYTIFTDSSCDLTPQMIKERGINCVSLSFKFEGNNRVYLSDEMPIENFYNKMRDGSIAKTSAVNPYGFFTAFEETLKKGEDILYLGFSSRLSTTYNSACVAAQQLNGRYPKRKIISVDTLAASAGIALLIDLVIQKKESGATIEEAAKYAEETKLKICHWFTVDDLMYLKNGGRISPATAFFGNVIGIKPILHVNNEGMLINHSKIRGRRTAIIALADKYAELSDKNAERQVYISHADCLSEAEFLSEYIKNMYGAKTNLITNVGTVIGAHSGPGTLALFFVGNRR